MTGFISPIRIEREKKKSIAFIGWCFIFNIKPSNDIDKRLFEDLNDWFMIIHS